MWSKIYKAAGRPGAACIVRSWRSDTNIMWSAINAGDVDPAGATILNTAIWLAEPKGRARQHECVSADKKTSNSTLGTRLQ